MALWDACFLSVVSVKILECSQTFPQIHIFSLQNEKQQQIKTP